MTQSGTSVAKLNLESINDLAKSLNVGKERLVEALGSIGESYEPFPHKKKPRPFAKKIDNKLRDIDNPRSNLKALQKRIYRRLLRPVCFPEHIVGAVKNRSVIDNAKRHMNADLLVTIDIKSCFPSITNKQIYRVWADILGCSPRVASILTKLTTYRRRLPQGAATSPLLANLFIWMIDQPIRKACDDLGVTYSTWIDDLAFSGKDARKLIAVAANELRAYGLRISRKKIKIMGPTAAKLVTGTRIGYEEVRAPKEKLSRVRSGIYKLRIGLVRVREQEKYINGLVGQIRFIECLNKNDAIRHKAELARIVVRSPLSRQVRGYLSLNDSSLTKEHNLHSRCRY